MAEKTIIDDESFYIDTTKNKTQAKLVDDRRADVTGEYPRNPYSHQSSINKSARGGRKSYVYTGGGDQVIDFVDAIPASRRKGSTYGKAKVQETPGGHVVEYDDTAGSERIMTRHKSGSGFEMLADGTCIYSSVGNSIRVVVKDEKVIVEGDAHLSYNGNLTLDVTGDFNVKVGGNYNVEVAGNKDEITQGSVSNYIGKNSQSTIRGNSFRTLLGSDTDQVLKGRNQITKGVFMSVGESACIQGYKGTLSLTSEEEVVLSSPDMNIAANDLSVFGATGTFGGDTITGYFQNVFCTSGTFTEGVTAPTFTGKLEGKADDACQSDYATSAGQAPLGSAGSPGSQSHTATNDTETARPTSAILSDYLDKSDRAYTRVSIDPGDYLKKSVDRSEFYGGVTDKDPKLSEARALLKDPDNADNTKFIGALLASGKIGSLYARPVPLYTGRQVNPVDAKLTGNTSLGQANRKSSKQFTSGVNSRLEEQLKKRGL